MYRSRLLRLVVRPAAVASLLGSMLLTAVLPAQAAPPGGPLAPDVAVGEGAPPLPSTLSSASWLVADLTSGQVLAARAGSAKRPPASTQKILTALTYGPGAPPEIEAVPTDAEVDGRRVGLAAGVRYRTADLLDALFVASGNDVAVALARSGGDPATAGDRMTATAQQLGATDTSAVNPTGLDADGQLTTAYDLALLTRAALSRPEIRRASALPKMTLTGSDGKARYLTSSNPLLGRYPGALGMKTGSTTEAGQTFVGAAERNGTTLAVILMQAPSSFGSEATTLLDWGFSAVGTTAPIASLSAPGSDAGAQPPGELEPSVVPPAEDGGGISPLLALALAVTVIAAAFTYWQGRESSREPWNGPPESGSLRERRTVAPRFTRLPDIADSGGGHPPREGATDDEDRQSSSDRESRSILAP